MSEVEVMRSEMLESEVIIEGEYVSTATMQEWGFSEYACCSQVQGWRSVENQVLAVSIVVYLQPRRNICSTP